MSNRSRPVTIVQVLLARHCVDHPGGCRRSCPSVPPPIRRRFEPQDVVLHIRRSRPVPLNSGRFQPAPPPQKVKRVAPCTQRGTATRDELPKVLPHRVHLCAVVGYDGPRDGAVRRYYPAPPRHLNRFEIHVSVLPHAQRHTAAVGQVMESRRRVISSSGQRRSCRWARTP